ncbi:uncharacterized protein LOC119185125 [Rhipicephalus microplus]|uniref:uncharacterized protein LOC119185125 n=1 Tax=Rhipicephalus microplus TaxID=6941 RepID=UPI003F6AD0A7
MFVSVLPVSHADAAKEEPENIRKTCLDPGKMNFNASFAPLVKSGIDVKIFTSVDKDALKSKELWVKNPSVTKNIITCYKEFMHVCNCNGHPTWYSANQCEQDEVRRRHAPNC